MPLWLWNLGMTRRRFSFDLAASTRFCYHSKLCEFYSFSESLNIPDTMPVLLEHVMQFMLFLMDKGMAASSVTIYLAAISFSAKASELRDPTSDFRICKMVEGFRRVQPSLPDNHMPITLTILHGVCREFESLCSSQYKIYLFQVN